MVTPNPRPWSSRAVASPTTPQPSTAAGPDTAARGDLFDRLFGSAPGQRYAGTTVAIVVDQQFVAERLGPHDEA